MEIDEITVDMFAGAGGASSGIEAAGIRVDVAINHDPVAVSLHRRNHPHTEHHVQDVYTLSPHWVTRGRPVGLLWMSPDCTHHSKAKGGAPTRNVKRRELAMVLVDRWIPELGKKAPRVVILENVEEFADWGPLDHTGRIIESARGERFKTFLRKLRSYGYRVEWRELRACDYGAPTIRKRLFMIARRDHLPIVWPAPTHGAPGSSAVAPGQLQPWRTAAECIDWSLPCPSIFATSAEIWEQYGLRAVRPLADNTLRRITKGIHRYVLGNSAPYIVSYYGTKASEFRGCGLDDCLPTQTTENRFALMQPFLTHHTLCTTHMVKMRGKNVGDAATSPLHTISAGGTHHALALIRMTKCKDTEHAINAQRSIVAGFLAKYYGQGEGQSVSAPMHTVTTKDHFGVVTVQIGGEPFALMDIGMRMLTPRELARAQGFPDSYCLERGAEGESITKTAQVRGIGNSVCLPMATALVTHNYWPAAVASCPSTPLLALCNE